MKDKTKEQLITELTDTKKQLNKLTKSEKLSQNTDEIHHTLAAIMEFLPDSIIVTNNQGLITYVNKAAETLSGRSSNELIGKSLDILCMEKEDKPIHQDIANRMKYPKKWHGEICKNREDGSTYMVEFEAFPVSQNNETVWAFIVRDITERKYAEKALRESEKRYRQLVEYSPDAIIIHNNNEVVFINSSGVTMAGVTSPEEIIGKSIMDFVHPDYHELVQKQIHQINNRKNFLPFFEYKVILPKGTVMTVEATSSIFTYQGQPAVQIILRDISQRKQMEKALQKSEEKLKKKVNYLNTLIENINELFFTYDKQGNLTFVNKKFWEVLGYKPTEVVGKSVLDFVHENYKEIIQKEIQARLKKAKPDIYEVQVIHKDGSKRFIKNNASSIIEDGEIKGGLVIAEDITERKRAEEELKNTINELRCTQKAMREREKLAIIGQMAAGMAHEIKNPLTSVRGFAQLLREKCSGDGTLAGYVSIILDESDQANRVITNFLQLSRPKQPTLKRQSINRLLIETLEIVEPQAFLKNIAVKYENKHDLPQCMIDRDQIKQVIFNMCQNAIEAMPSGGIIQIRSNFLQNNAEIYLDIQDTGCGIPDDKLENIGDPFYTTKDDGTGLGLSISYAIIDAHKGRIEVESKENNGTKFRIYLPC